MKKVYVVMQVVDDYPEMGGGEYIHKIFGKKEEAEEYAEKMTLEAKAEWDAEPKCALWEEVEDGDECPTSYVVVEHDVI